MRRLTLTIVLTLVSLFAVASAAQAVVLDMGAAGHFGVALVPGTDRAGLPTVTSSGSCLDPALTSDFGGPLLPSGALCSHGGSVMHGNETFAEVWDPRPHIDYASPYVEQFLREVANGSGTLTSPYAVTTQYTDGGGRAGNASIYGGGYDTRTGYPPQVCTRSGVWHFHLNTDGSYSDALNNVCLTDTQLRTELQAMIAQEGLVGRIQPGYTPLLVLLTPPGVVTCLDVAGTMCSANSTSAVQFCSYHSQVNAAGRVFDYVVQPWTAQTGCDEPDAPKFPADGKIDPATLMNDTGSRLVSPLSRSQIAAIVNPALDGWFAQDGSEIDDNGCAPLNLSLDSVTVGSGSYLLQHEFNNGGVIVNDPWAPACAGHVDLVPSFVVPSAVNPGDVVKLDGSNSPSTLLIPRADYVWSLGDGTTAVGPSVVHSYATGGTYSVTLTVTDRGGNVRSLSQTIYVLGSGGQQSPGLHVSLQLMPQGLLAALRHGVAIQVSSNKPADGIATLSISRGAAKRAHIHAGRGPSVVIGRGTVSGIRQGTVHLHLRLPRAVSTKLKRLRHVTLTVRLAFIAAGGQRLALVAAGRY